MKNFFSKNIFRSLYYYRKDAVYQIIIVAILTAVITGSLLTGESVRSSLRRTANEKLGSVDIVISSGLRYFDPSLAGRFEERSGEKAVAILEMDGYCQDFSTGESALNTKILGVSEDFFLFNAGKRISIEPGTIAINKRLATFLNIKEGDEIIVHFRSIDPIPANAPFAAREAGQDTRVFKTGIILGPEQSGNFSLGVSQIVPMNIFMNIMDFSRNSDKKVGANRLLIANGSDHNMPFFSDVLSEILKFSDIGLSMRRSQRTGEPELISDRIFIDSTIVDAVLDRFQSALPVITYLANEIYFKGRSTPYSFISGITSQITMGLRDDQIIINKWVADDLGAKTGDSLAVSWFVQGFRGKLDEKRMNLIIAGIVDNESNYSDPSLMPDFPGISGKTTCSEWDAGIPVLLYRIREKDEEYWNIYKGTPKAFISYKSGRKLWANNFGTATAVRFPPSMSLSEIEKSFTGTLDPETSGFNINDIRNISGRAAEEGTDFGSLFLSLSFFILISCIVLLSMAVSIFFDSRKKQVKTFFALGFRDKDIRKMFFTEAAILSISGAIPGVIIGYLMNMLIISALNGVWSGAVQTDTLSPGFNILPFIYSFLITVIITSILIIFKTRSFLTSLYKIDTGELKVHSALLNNLLLLAASIAFSGVVISALFIDQFATVLYFIAGILLFITLVLLLRSYYVKNKKESGRGEIKNISAFSRRYYFFNPSQAITPVIIIAAGIYAVIITSKTGPFNS
ncbi:MAG: ABC transporter permease [Bacteroidia bacterium]|nr:ABC transporter permease [Bacteroidia bacterium]